MTWVCQSPKGDKQLKTTNYSEDTNPQRLILTHWEPAAYLASQDTYILQELIISALVYGEVLIKDSDLVLNDHVITHLSHEHNYEIFAELLRLGLVKILTLPIEYFPQNMSADPSIEPISARAEEISLRKTLGEMIWTPDNKARRLYKNIDNLLLQSPNAIRTVKPMAEDNPFAKWLGKFLKEREHYQLERIPQFKGIDGTIAEVLIRCCDEQGYWIKFLRDHGKTTEKTGEGGKFYRSGAYQVLSLFPDNPGVQSTKNLIQSVFNSWYCENEEAHGRWGGKLIEAPYSYSSEDEANEAVIQAIKTEIVYSKRKIKFLENPDIGMIILKTKERMQNEGLIETLPSSEIQERLFHQKWEIISEIFAENIAQSITKLSSVEKRVWELAPVVFTGASQLLGFGISTGSLAIVSELITDFIIGILGPNLSKAVRAAVTTQRISHEVSRALETRFSKVQLIAESKSNDDC